LSRYGTMVACGLICGFAWCTPRVVDAGTRYSIDWAAVRASPPVNRNEAGDYACSVERKAPDATASRLLGIAECAYPPTAVVAELAGTQGFEFGADTSGAFVWWERGKNERRIPYAATRAALEHYLKLTTKYRKRDYKEPGARIMYTSKLIYLASIDKEAEYELGDSTFTGVYVASVHLMWTYDDGTFQPTVTARRTTVLSPKGEILAVDGDGRAIEDVSISANQSIGGEKQLLH